MSEQDERYHIMRMNGMSPSGMPVSETQTHSNRIDAAREAILQELKRRWKEGRHSSGVTAPSDISRFYKPQTNYFCGAGEMQCPICGAGTLHYHRSNYNGHVHARCTTDKCVIWSE